MKAVLNNVAFFALTLFVVSAHGQQQSSMELSCRAKAKEVAAQTYNSCVTEARNSQVDQIRKDYQKQLADLKNKYDKELKKIGGKGINTAPSTSTAATTKPAPVSASTGSTPKATKGIAKTLPTRKEVKTPAAPAIQASQEDKTVSLPDSSTPGLESESTQNDANSDLKIELVPAPAGNDIGATTSGEVY